MVFYDSLHTGYWRVSLNEQYIWRWLRENGISLQCCTKLAVGRIAYLVEDRLNTETFKELINVDKIIKEIYLSVQHAENKIIQVFSDFKETNEKEEPQNCN